MKSLLRFITAKRQEILSALMLAALAWPTLASSPWSFSFDNDFLVPSSRDQDYTYGLSLNLHDIESLEPWVSPRSLLTPLEKLVGVSGEAEPATLELGLYGFTPEQTKATQQSGDDRPFSSLIYVSSSRILHSPNPKIKWRTAVTVGALGLPLVGSLQNSFHSMIDNDKVKGWNQQISEGGELTARVSAANQKLIYENKKLELKRTVSASVGYLTEASYALNLRFGNIQSHWYRNSPELSFYRESGVPGNFSNATNERYWFVGFAIKQRLYNVFLQGQFRDSEHTYDTGDLNHTLFEAWVGYVAQLSETLQLTYSVRAHQSELKQGIGNRTVIWGGFNLARLL